MTARPMPHPFVHHQLRAAWVGCIVAPACWFLSQMTTWIMTGDRCEQRVTMLVVTAGFCIVLLLAAAVSAFTWRRSAKEGDKDDFTTRRAHFVSAAGTFFPLIFLLILVWQGVAEFIFSGCEK